MLVAQALLCDATCSMQTTIHWDLGIVAQYLCSLLLALRLLTCALCAADGQHARKPLQKGEAQCAAALTDGRILVGTSKPEAQS